VGCTGNQRDVYSPETQEQLAVSGLSMKIEKKQGGLLLLIYCDV
jgi:hypothetical protein